MLEYPFDAFDGSGGRFDRQKTGERTFDFNFDGLAHVGLMPDFLADVRTLEGDGGESLEPLFNSAETFIRMWERIEQCTPDEVAPTISCPPDSVHSAGPGGTLVDFEPPPSAEDFCDHLPEVTTDIASGSVFDPGTTTVTATALDDAGNSSTCEFDVSVSCFAVNRLNIKRRGFARRNSENSIELRGTFMAGAAFDPTASDVTFTIDDHSGNSYTIAIPAGSFQKKTYLGGPWYVYRSGIRSAPRVTAVFNSNAGAFLLQASKCTGSAFSAVPDITVGLEVEDGENYSFGEETVDVALRREGLTYEAYPRHSCVSF